MSRVLENMDGDIPARQQAEAWFARLMAPGCTPDERAAFERWRGAAPGHADAYAATERLWARLEGLENDTVVGPYARAALEPEPAVQEAWAAAVRHRPLRPASYPATRTRRRWRWPAAVAAGLLVAALGLRWFPLPWPVAEPRHYGTGNQPQAVTLADGSRIHMDLSTRMDVRMGRRARAVELLQGRAVFEVAHDAERPFAVDTGHGTVTALGTRFQVDREAEQIVVTLLEGSVSVAGQDGTAELRLAPGEQARYSPRPPYWTRRSVDAAAVTSWMQGFHVFGATPLAEAVREINRYSAVKLRLADPALESLVLSGNFKTGDARAIADALPLVLPVQVATGVDEIILAHR